MASHGTTESQRIENEIAQLQVRRKTLEAREARDRAAADAARAEILVEASPAKRLSIYQMDPYAAGPSRQPLFVPKPKPEPPLFRTELPAQSSLASAFASIRSEGPVALSSTHAASASGPIFSGTAADEVDEIHKQNAKRILDSLELGPKDLGKRTLDWDKVEPYSKLRLSGRVMDHEQVQANMEGRYHVSPSTIYSVMNLKRNRREYDIPVEADWVTIGVVVETDCRGYQVKDDEKSKASDEEGNGENARQEKQREEPYWKSKAAKPGQHKAFRRFKMTTLPTKAERVEGMEVGGDAMVQVLMFQADEKDVLPDGKTVYRGGSKGAFEKWANIDVGSVVALVTPKIFPPYGNNKAPNAYTNPVALMVQSHTDLWVIGRCPDVAQCKAIKRNGDRCYGWYDKRAAKTCEFHLNQEIDRTKKGRAEFASSTSRFQSGYSARSGGAGSTFGQGAAGKPIPQSTKGLLSKFGAGSLVSDGVGQTYVIEGSAISTGRVEPQVGDRLGRAKAERAKRKRDAMLAERDLQELLKKDGNGSATTGGKYLEAAKRLKAGSQKESSASGAEKALAQSDSRPRTFHAEAVKRLGFDPSREGRSGYETSEASRTRLEAIALLQSQKGPVRLGRLPGKSWSKSSVRAPVGHAPVAGPPIASPSASEMLVDLDSEDEDDED